MIWFRTYHFDFPAGARRPELRLSRTCAQRGVWYRYKGDSVKAWIPQRNMHGYINPVFTGCIVRQADGQISLRGRFRPLWVVLFGLPSFLVLMVAIWSQGQITDSSSGAQLAPLFSSMCMVLGALGVVWWYSTARARKILVALAEATETWDVPR